MAVNHNAAFTDLAGEAPQQLPVGIGLNAGGDFWKKFEVEFTAVTSGLDPVTRPAIVRELLQYMNMDTKHFTGGFNIMRLTIKKTEEGFGFYVLHIPHQRIKTGCFMSFVLYHKIVGQADWWWCDHHVKGRWHQNTYHLFSGKSARAYDRGGYIPEVMAVVDVAVKAGTLKLPYMVKPLGAEGILSDISTLSNEITDILLKAQTQSQ